RALRTPSLPVPSGPLFYQPSEHPRQDSGGVIFECSDAISTSSLVSEFSSPGSPLRHAPPQALSPLQDLLLMVGTHSADGGDPFQWNSAGHDLAPPSFLGSLP